jgi:hypothetical protein
MTLTLELTPEEEAKLHAKAARAGMEETAYLRSLIAGRRQPQKGSNTPAEMVAYWQANGLLTGYGDPDKDSIEVARELRDKFSQRENAS